jgi:hypothetical protein
LQSASAVPDDADRQRQRRERGNASPVVRVRLSLRLGRMPIRWARAMFDEQDESAPSRRRTRPGASTRGARPSAPTSGRRRPGGKRKNNAGLGPVMFTIPVCLVMGTLLLLLGLVWFASPEGSPYRIGAERVGLTLLGGGAALLVVAAFLMMSVSRKVASR